MKAALRAPANSRRGDEEHSVLSPIWLRATAVAGVLAVLSAIWWLSPAADVIDPERVSLWFAPFRHVWYAMPLVALAYVVLGLAMVPVLLLVAATGIAFGPWLGPLYAMAGCLTSASAGFLIGRRLGLERIQRIGGERVTRLSRALQRNGTLAVFILRKVPAPFTLANVVAGASSVSYRDFFIGTLLGMGALVIALAGFGYQLAQALRAPSPRTLLVALGFVGVPLSLAWYVNRTLRRRYA